MESILNSKSLPKILITGSNFNPQKGVGITMANLFKDYPKEKLVIANNTISEYDKETCKSFFPFHSGVKNSKPLLPGIIRRTKAYQIFRSTMKARQYLSLCTKLSESYAGNLEFENWLQQEKPDLIYAMVINDISKIPYLIYLKERLNIPLVLHIVDDWISLNYFGIFELLYRKKLNAQFKSMLDRSNVLLCISDAMATEYLKRYSKEFKVIHNPADESLFLKLSKPPFHKSSLQIVYYGTVEEYHLKELIILDKAIASLNKGQETFRAHIYGSLRKPEYLSNLNSCKHIDYKGFIAPKDLFEVLGNYDILFLPLSFKKSLYPRIRLSMPTKVSEYMMSPQPILLFAPGGLAVTDYALKEKWAYVVDKNSVDLLKKALLDITASESLRNVLVSRANEVAKSRHTINIVQKEFISMLINCTA